VQGFVRFTVEVRVKDLEGSVHQNMRKKVLKIRSLSPRAASALGLIVTLRNMLPIL
jgi:ribosomal protein S3AE